MLLLVSVMADEIEDVQFNLGTDGDSANYSAVTAPIPSIFLRGRDLATRGEVGEQRFFNG